ncbi:sugar phosphate nucleotidyltransferase [Bacillus sp. B1-b2]|uniref:sugar phosphate nucleotidyltransferase n=1 Tax=Bacillus sp. B1-b2 TaxID=2653201 RepID=UPI0012626854|nr:sugar phosphate nucleotidyltransferase [Bacillus sp. B1-b2]KAB7668458.1 cupin domain-containing protein [Bacillus sp. B1-b2]
MNIVLLSGGSGKRLWPLSNDSRSKQFLKVLENENKERISMVQRVFMQLNSLNLDKDTVIATSESQVDMIYNQIGENVPIVIEPERRDTFAAIALSAVYLYSNKKIPLDEVVCILPVDSYVENSFFESVCNLERVLQETDAEIALIGVEPTYPSSKYGYIIPTDSNDNKEYFQVSHFREKPTEEIAKQLILENGLWNCGVFAFKLGYIISLLESQGLPTVYDELVNQYHSLPKNSFDYEVVEKSKKIVALPYKGYWKDLGTWNTLTEEVATSITGKGKISEDSINTHLVNELDIPVTIIGCSDIIVAASPDGILVSDKSASPRLKDYIHEYDQIPMYEERKWGWYKILDFNKYDREREVITKRICIFEGENLSYHYHKKRSELWNIIQGTGILILDGKKEIVNAGDVVKLPPNSRHSIKALSDLEIIEVQTGSEITNEDIYREVSSWEEINSFISSSSQNR